MGVDAQITAVGNLQRAGRTHSHGPPTISEINSAWEKLFTQKERMLRRVVARIVPESCIDDILSDAYLAVRQAAPQAVREPDEFAAYVTATVKRLAVRRFKRLRAESGAGAELAREQTSSFVLEELVQRRALCSLLQEAIDDLPEAQRKAYLLAAMYDLSAREIAEQTESNQHTVTQRIRRARQRVFSRVQLTSLGRLCPEYEADIRRLLTTKRRDGRLAVSYHRAHRHLAECSGCRSAAEEHERLTKAIAFLTPPIFIFREIWRQVVDSVSGALDGVQAIAYRVWTAAFGAGRDATAVVSGWGAPTRICAGAACVLVAGGAAGVGVKKGHDAKVRKAAISQPDNRGGDVDIGVPLTSGPAPLPVDVPRPAHGGDGGGEEGSAPQSSDSPGQATGDAAEPAESNFEPDNAGTPTGQPRTASPPEPPKSQSKPLPTGGGEEFQP